ncbi:hydroxypyruvate isomerase family protein [Hydrogenophaga soli]
MQRHNPVTMPQFAANLTLLYTELPFLDRFAAAAADGFRAVECLFPYEHPPEAIAARLQAHGLTQALFNLPPGDWAAGERGMACHPGREAEFAASVQTALRYALATGCQRLHAMAGLAPAGVDADTRQRTYVANLKAAARVLAPHGITLLIEPINTRDMPGYFLNRQQQAHDTVAAVGEPNVRVQMDFYHCQIMEGDLTRRLEQHLPGVGHIQIASVPDRHEPDAGEVAYAHLFARLDALGYRGFVGCEYRPRASGPGGTSAGLGWFAPWRASQRSADQRPGP